LPNGSAGHFDKYQLETYVKQRKSVKYCHLIVDDFELRLWH